MKNKKEPPPPLIISNNKVIGIGNWDRKPAYENSMAESIGLMATCNSCDRIIFEDENYMEKYSENGGYCKDCD